MATKPRAKSAFAQLSRKERGFAETLRERIRDSILPGEPPLEGHALDEATAFVIEAARQREEGQSSILVQSAAEGRRFMRIAVINKDMPFLVDSIAATMAARGLSIQVLVHPMLPVRRKNGAIADLPQGDTGEKKESWIYIETARVDARERRALEKELSAAIEDVRAAVADWAPMRTALEADADRLSDSEGAALLRWLAGGMMTQLGHVIRTREGKQTKAMGICRASTSDLLAEDAYKRAFAWFDGNGAKSKGAPGKVPLIIKANRLSKVHRRVPLDLFIVPLFEDGRVSALSIHAGIWTSAALVSPPETVPVLRQQLKAIMERMDFEPGSHDYKSLVHALTTLPHDLMISFSQEDITRVAIAMMGLDDRPRPRATLITAPLGRHVFGFVWLPRDMMNTQVRLSVQDLLEEHTGASTLDWSLSIEGGNLALLRYVMDYRGKKGEPDTPAIDRALGEMLRGWNDAVEEALAASEDESRAVTLTARYASAFPAYYRATYGPAEAAIDIGRMRHLSANAEDDGAGRDARLYLSDKDEVGQLRLKVYQHRGSLPLSDAVPALENFGFKVLSEVPTTLETEDKGTIHDFILALPTGIAAGDLLERSEAIEHAITAVLNERAEDDVFNRLIVMSALVSQEADWLRAFYRYLRQSAIAFTIYTVVDALAGAPKVTRGLIALLRAMHDPAFDGDRAGEIARVEGDIRAGLADVVAINDDRLLRRYWDTLRAVLRTNAFAPAGNEALAFKFDSTLVPGLPKPVPWREIWVYSRRVEGIHLRAGPVARGGLRWSDRRDDFRTEILGLMKAQKVKNAVIVPTGAKGGFYPKRLPNPAIDRDAWFAEGKESYKLFIRTLLSVTDNLVDDKVVHPEDVVIRDGEDPYFVVAADKGTSTFSDTANAIAIAHDFWLGDAFASGGSNGYDHKAMGITARGAWVCVQRHFLEMGVDVQTDPVRVVGCGDMSGDVFGNGMLLSKAIRLVAAFDHRHIFIDPDPDAAKSWKERNRLFGLERSSWADYKESLLSKGGAIIPRTAKRIELSSEAMAALGIEEGDLKDGALDPDGLIRLILKSPVDLVWFGGIGTYIKATHESNADVGDPANDGLRINGNDLRAKVIGEGANLGLTQAGRVEFALGGGRVNTDFIDNSAGVDCSDNEVNIKIALTAARRAGRLSEERRNALLAEMTEDVAALVLEDNRLQALALSIAEQGGARSVGAQARLIEMLEEMGGLDRANEGLADGEGLARRAADGHGLTRPELAVLLSHSKLVIQDAVERGKLPADPAADALVLGDFPPQMRDTYKAQLLSHRLRPEIVGTVVANKLVNRMGMIHPFELAEEEGEGLAAVGSAFVAATALLGMDAVWETLDTATMPETARLMLFDQAALALRGHVADLLRAGDGEVSPAALQDQIGPMVAKLDEQVETLLGDEARAHVDAIAARMTAEGASEEHAQMVARLFAVDGAIGLSRLASETGIKPVALAHAFVDLGTLLGIDWAQSRAAIMNPADPWERLLVSGLARDFQQMRFDFLRGLARKRGKDAGDPQALIGTWAARHTGTIAQFRRMIARAQAATPVAPAMLAQIASQARNLLQGQGQG
ncbi:glutamate dehydrogenase [Erythrobacter arachoides]|uniref:Glutamate dehydrogenase n=1 Tax=Aurantiacibacter arachoides TaxID=1850444 RepID=A0A845A2J2_9SPHN|nr:NAD-glutamate dehydrogenase domain-containing protein [Aurantiacibacter arachoides]MXO94773.1 glutamate dehydrogenase [Aurantiacibacter arachoides]GGD60818.1 NAD-glutamate dehydrogenase [Aurantiacibacter arachoides]